MPNYKIISTDLDGTLLQKDQTVSPENLAAMEELTRRGVQVAVNSGRSLYEIGENVRNLPHVRYILCADGAVIYDKQTDTRYVQGMDKDLTRQVLDILADYDVNFSVRNMGYAYDDAAHHNEEDYTHARISRLYQAFLFYYCKPVADFDRFCRELDEVEMICAFFHSDEELAACKARLEATGRLKVASSEPANLEIFSTKAGKGNALLRLANILGVDPAATIAVGDTTNDLPMIRAAGLGLAVDNAWDELKTEADQVICRYDQHVMEYILKNYF